MYTITLTDGKQITNLELNGTNYVSEVKIDEHIFEHNLSTMKVSDGETENTYTDMIFVQQMEIDGKYYLAFRAKTQYEKLAETIIKNSSSVTDMQIALAEVYEMIAGGK
jgi:hypothetical protein|nr:MAG TPA: hypothetical protein [Caudoviricetes sp.]